MSYETKRTRVRVCHAFAGKGKGGEQLFRVRNSAPLTPERDEAPCEMGRRETHLTLQTDKFALGVALCLISCRGTMVALGFDRLFNASKLAQRRFQIKSRTVERLSRR